MNNSRVAVSTVRCRSYVTGAVENAVRIAIDLLGGIEKFIRPGSKVLIKPNILSGREPSTGVNTNPEVVRAVARLVRTVTDDVCVGDSPAGWHIKKIDYVYQMAGITDICRQEGLRLVKFDKAMNMGGFPFTTVLRDVDVVISVPKLKTHSSTILTGAVKNMFGTVVGLAKAQCHLRAPAQKDFVVILADMFSHVKPALSVMDGIVGMEGDGPTSGQLRNIGLIMASGDAVALDAVFADIAGLNPLKVPLIREVSERGLGIADLAKIDIVGQTLRDSRIEGFKIPKTAAYNWLPGFLVKVISGLINFSPRIDKEKCKGCGLCSDICAAKAIAKVEGGAYTIETKRCIKCLCCHEVCPHKAVEIKKSCLARMIMRKGCKES